MGAGSAAESKHPNHRSCTDTRECRSTALASNLHPKPRSNRTRPTSTLTTPSNRARDAKPSVAAPRASLICVFFSRFHFVCNQPHALAIPPKRLQLHEPGQKPTCAMAHEKKIPFSYARRNPTTSSLTFNRDLLLFRFGSFPFFCLCDFSNKKKEKKSDLSG